MNEYKKGDVVLVSFTKKQNGQIVAKRRPAVIVTSLDNRDDVWVVPLTSGSALKPGCVMVKSNSEEGRVSGLRIDSLIDCNVIATIPKALLVNRIGHLSDETIARFTEKLRQNGQL